MGCAPSLLEEDTVNSRRNEDMNDIKLEFQIDSTNADSVLSSYIALDKNIIEVENSSPAPMYGRAVASLRYLKHKLEQIDLIPSGYQLDDHNDVYKMFMDLGLHRSPNVAAEHEEFIANANRKVLEINYIQIIHKIIAANENKMEICSQKVQFLQKLYQQQEALLMNVFGGSYGSEREKSIEQETDTMRNFRDTLAIGVLQWEDSAEDLRISSENAQRGLISLKTLKKQHIEKKLKLATDARNSFQEAVFLVQQTQETLPGVQFPYCSARELASVIQALEYIFTDILIEERYHHALQVYENFQQRIDALLRWMTKTLTSSLQIDLKEFDEKVSRVAKKLREERIQQICSKLKIPNNYSEFGLNPKVHNIRPVTTAEPTSLYQKPMEPERRYKKENMYGDVLNVHQGHRQLINLGPALGFRETNNPIFTDPNLQRDFEDKLAARRSAMWPSRRMEELRQLIHDT